MLIEAAPERQAMRMQWRIRELLEPLPREGLAR